MNYKYLGRSWRTDVDWTKSKTVYKVVVCPKALTGDCPDCVPESCPHGIPHEHYPMCDKENIHCDNCVPVPTEDFLKEKEFKI